MSAIEVRKKDVYVTTDATEFEDEVAATEHQSMLDSADGIYAFIEYNMPDSKGRFKESITKKLVAYEAFKAVTEISNS